MSSSGESNIAIAKTVISAVGSAAAMAMLAHNLPQEVQDYIFFGLRSVLIKFSNQMTMVIDEFDGMVSNEVYESAQIYLGSKLSPDTRRFKVSKPEKEKSFNTSMERNEEVVDVYKGEKFKWIWICKQVGTSREYFYNPRDMNSTLRSEVRSYELTFHRKHKELVLECYLAYIINEAKLLKLETRTLKIHTMDYENMHDLSAVWTPVNLDHPATFETLAMDSEQKDMIAKDLDRFVQRKDYYRRVGKAWKRGYLLYGPPGTGKSSLIAAVANYLNFDVYDLELTEDIDATIDLQEKLSSRVADPSNESHEEGSEVTLSGLLNFIDGLWSSCGDERIIIFTTNHIEKLDPALLRPGRMDMHIHMSYCTPSGFRLLASNYLGVIEHQHFEKIESLIETNAVTPAEVAEQLMKDDEVDIALKGLIDFLHMKKKEHEEAYVERGKVGNFYEFFFLFYFANYF
ncbi:putative transcription factor ORG2-like [Capsicum annuum]|nr:putative transcription factor ORG2-like [Capsicum annuum]